MMDQRYLSSKKLMILFNFHMLQKGRTAANKRENRIVKCFKKTDFGLLVSR